MKQKKEPIVKDERTMLLDGKIAGELVLGMTCFIALSAFVKASILDLALVAYIPELILLIVMGVYAFVRRISSGIDIRDMLEKDSWFSRHRGRHLICLICDRNGCDWEARNDELYVQPQVSAQNRPCHFSLCPFDLSVRETTCSYQSEKTKEDRGRVRGLRGELKKLFKNS